MLIKECVVFKCNYRFHQYTVVWCVYIIEIYKKGMFHVYCPNWVSKFAFRANNIQYRYTCRCTNVSFVTQNIIFYTPVFKTGRTLYYGIHCTNVWLSVRPFHMSRSNLRTPWPIHFKFHRVIGIDGLTVCILYGEISNFHSRVMGLYSSNCRRFFVCRAVNWEPLGQFTSNFA